MKLILTIKEVKELSKQCNLDCENCKRSSLCLTLCGVVPDVPTPNEWNDNLCKSIVRIAKESVK